MTALCSVEDSDVSSVLGFPIITKAEPYTATDGNRGGPLIGGNGGGVVRRGGGHDSWLVAAVVVTSLLALIVFLAFLFLVHR